MMPMLLNSLDKNPLSSAILRRVYGHRMCFSMLVVGPMQSRKSTGTITLAKQLNPDFSLEKDMAVISGQKFQEVLRANHKRGDVLLADDFGIGLNHRQWFSFINKALNFAMQTHGYKGLIIILTVPYENFIDKDTRLLFNMELTTVAKNDKEGWVKFRVEELQHVEDHRTHEVRTYKTLLRMRYPDGSIRRVMNTKVYYPPKPLLDRYFEIANTEKAKLQYDMKAEGDAIAKRQNKESFNPNKFVEEIMLHPEKFQKEWRGHRFCQASVIEEEFKTNHSQAKVIKELAEKRLGLA